MSDETPKKQTHGSMIISDASFESDVLKAQNKLTLVDFWAPWCAPCRSIAPFIERLAIDFQGEIKVAKCNIDENPKIASMLGIRSIPTIILFKGEEIVFEIHGAPDPQALVDQMEDALNALDN